MDGLFSLDQFTVKVYFAVGRLVKLENGTSDGGLAAAGFTDETERLAFVDIKGDIVNGFQLEGA